MKNKDQPKRKPDAPERQLPPLPEPDKSQRHIMHHVAWIAGLKALSEIKRTKKPYSR